MILYPAIDLLGGRVVRLRQGDYADATEYGTDPASVARGFVEAGASWIHVVDLDAAKTGSPVNRGVIAEIAAVVDGVASVQTGGGVRSVEDARALVRAGVARVVMGSAAVANPAVVNDVADVVPVAVGLDHRAGVVSVDGWTRSSGATLEEMFDAFPRAAAFVITDISRDGMLEGPDVEGLARAAHLSPIPVIASGGVGSLRHLRHLAIIEDLTGVIVGRALYEGAFDVAGALAALAAAGDGSEGPK